MTAFPGGIPVFAGFTASHTLAADSHAAQHNLEQTEVVQIANKIGTGASTPVNNRLLRGNGTGTSQWAQADLTSDVTGTLPIANGGTGASTASAALISLGSLTIQQVYPVGCIYSETIGVNPGTTFGFGTWIAFGAGRVLVGKAGAGTFSSAGSTGGEETHVLTLAESPAHTHGYATTRGGVNWTGGAAQGNDPSLGAFGTNTDSKGGDGAHNNLQPYIVVYYWTRTV